MPLLTETAMARYSSAQASARRSRRTGACARAVAGLLLLSALALPSCPAMAQDSAFVAAMREGRAAYKANDWATAEKHFDAAAKASENDRQKSTAFYALGVVAQKQNKLPEAKQRAEQVLAINPGDKLSKGLLDEVNAASVPAAKGKTKPASKGLAKTPFEPGRKQAASAAAAKSAQPKAAGDAGKASSKPVAPKAAAPKGSPAKPQAPGDGAPPAAPGKASALEPPVAEPPAHAVLAAAMPEASNDPESREAEKVSAMATQEPASLSAAHVEEAANAREQQQAANSPTAAIVTGGLPQTPPVSAATAAVLADAPAPLPQRARYVEMGCGPDYRADGKLFARAFEVPGGADGQGEVLTFDLACVSSRNGSSGAVPVAAPITEDSGGQIRLARLQRAPEGGWTFGNDAGERLARFRPEAEILVLLPSEGEVAVLRRQLARDPARLEALSPDVRRDLERAVAGEGFPEFRIVRADDRLDAAFEQARKLAKRIDGRTAAAPTN